MGTQLGEENTRLQPTWKKTNQMEAEGSLLDLRLSLCFWKIEKRPLADSHNKQINQGWNLQSSSFPDRNNKVIVCCSSCWGTTQSCFEPFPRGGRGEPPETPPPPSQASSAKFSSPSMCKGLYLAPESQSSAFDSSNHQSSLRPRNTQRKILPEEALALY